MVASHRHAVIAVYDAARAGDDMEHVVLLLLVD
jgi:hypothetical protein